MFVSGLLSVQMMMMMSCCFFCFVFLSLTQCDIGFDGFRGKGVWSLYPLPPS